MKTILYIGAVCFSLMLRAQEADTLLVTDHHRQEAILMTLMSELNLTESQIPQVESLLTDRTSQIATVRDNGGSFEESRAAIDGINLAIRQQLKLVLTAEQLDLYISNRRALKASREEAGITRNSIDQLVEDF